MKEIKNPDIKLMIDRLVQLELKDEFDQCCIDSTIDMLEDLGNIVHDLLLDNAILKQEILHLEAIIDD